MIFEHKTYADDETGAVIHAKIPYAPDVPMDDRPAPLFSGVCIVKVDERANAEDEFIIPGDTLAEAFANFAAAYESKAREMDEVIEKNKRQAQQERSRPKIVRATDGVRRFR